MKKIFFNIAVLLSAVSLSSCVLDNLDDASVNKTVQGAVSISFDMPAGATRTDADAYPWKDDCDIRIYKRGELGKELIRHYFGPDEMPQELWLLEGDYAVGVSLGRREAATFDRPSHEGYAEFSIEAGRVSTVEVECAMLNTMVEVRFDQSVSTIFDNGYSVRAMVAEQFDSDKMESVPSLTYEGYTGGRSGYFILPEGSSDISFCFHGYSSNENVKDVDGDTGEIHRHFVKHIDSDKSAGYKYILNLKYSRDAEGFLQWDFEVTVDTSEDKIDDTPVGINPSSKPSVSGMGFELAEVTDAAGELSYRITSQSNLRSIQLDCEGRSFFVDCKTSLTADNDGITLTGESLKDMTLTLNKAFFDNFEGGEHSLAFTVVNEKNADVRAVSRIRTAGAFSMEATEKWFARGEIKAYAFGSPGSVQVQYRVKESGEWTTVAATGGADNLWTASGCEGIGPDTEFEYQLIVDGQTTGAAKSFTTDKGPQLPNGDMEIWTEGSKYWSPYNDAEQYWDSGNGGSTTVGSTVVTFPSDDVREGAAGVKSAYLKTGKVLNMFPAAGNIFTGKFVGTNSTNGVVDFGKPLNCTYRPKAMKVWLKANAGADDTNNVYIVLCNMGGPHVVNTGDKSTLMTIEGIKTMSYCSNPSYSNKDTNDQEDGHVVAWASWDNTGNISDWYELTLPLNYNEEYMDEIPNYVIVAATASKRGDYLEGSTDSWMYVDDFELVY